jgi:hypothetical protein
VIARIANEALPARSVWGVIVGRFITIGAAFILLVGLGTTTWVSAADCLPAKRVYSLIKTLDAADAYISCLEGLLVAIPGALSPVAGEPAMGTPMTGGPTAGTPVPGAPAYDQIEELLLAVKRDQQISDYAWTQLMASALNDTNALTLVYDKAKLDPAYSKLAPFVVDAGDPANLARSTQVFADPGQFSDIQKLKLGGAIE